MYFKENFNQVQPKLVSTIRPPLLPQGFSSPTIEPKKSYMPYLLGVMALALILFFLLKK